MNFSDLLKQKIPPTFYQRIVFLSKTCARSSLKPYLVGGIVRDMILSCPSQNELDITIEGGNLNHLARQLSQKWSAKLISYPQFLTFTLEFTDGSSMDLITTRKERYPFPASLPVVRMGSLRDDLARRDFSVNAMAVSISIRDWGRLVDLHNGLRDLKEKKIRILHRKSFEDDPTRIFRAARFASRFSFELERKTTQWLKQSIRRKDIQKLSPDRIRNELEKILLEEKCSSSLGLLASWKSLNQIHPLLKWKQSERFSKAFDSLSKEAIVPEELKVVRLALWLNHFACLEVQQILGGLKFTKQNQEQIFDLCALGSELSCETKISAMPQRKLAQHHFLFIQALQNIGGNTNLKKRWQDYERWMDCAARVNGDDLRKAGFKPGPIYKKIFCAVRKEKFKGKLKTKEEELRFAIDNFSVH